MAIDLRLARGKPPVPHGDRGLSRKSAEAGNASYYYSLTSTSALGSDQIGWNWYALQLSNGHELMFYRLRRRDGSTDPHSAGTIVLRDGRPVALAAGEVLIDTLSTWVSPRGGHRYPARTRLRVPKADLELEVTPRLPYQELEVSARAERASQRGSSRRLTGVSPNALFPPPPASSHHRPARPTQQRP